MRVITALLLLGLAGCAAPAGGGSDAGASPSPSPSSSADVGTTDNDLLVVLDRGYGTEPERYTLVCGEVADGDHPDPEAACVHLEDLEQPFAPLPADMVCTEQYGGPQTARITGRWHAGDVDVELSRTDGCRIFQWDSLGPLLPPVEGAVPD